MSASRSQPPRCGQKAVASRGGGGKREKRAAAAAAAAAAVSLLAVFMRLGRRKEGEKEGSRCDQN